MNSSVRRDFKSRLTRLKIAIQIAIDEDQIGDARIFAVSFAKALSKELFKYQQCDSAYGARFHIRKAIKLMNGDDEDFKLAVQEVETSIDRIRKLFAK